MFLVKIIKIIKPKYLQLLEDLEDTLKKLVYTVSRRLMLLKESKLSWFEEH